MATDASLQTGEPDNTSEGLSALLEENRRARTRSWPAPFEMQRWFRSIRDDIKRSSTRNSHPAPFPVELAERLIRMFSFAGDRVLDPFMGLGSSQESDHGMSVSSPPMYRLLASFERIFRGRIYRHRASTQGDVIAIELYEDLYHLAKSTKLRAGIDSRERGL